MKRRDDPFVLRNGRWYAHFYDPHLAIHIGKDHDHKFRLALNLTEKATKAQLINALEDRKTELRYSSSAKYSVKDALDRVEKYLKATTKGKTWQKYSYSMKDLRAFLDNHTPVDPVGLSGGQYLFWRSIWGDPEDSDQQNYAISIVNQRLKRLFVKNFHSKELKKENPETKKKYTIQQLMWKLDLPSTHSLRATWANDLLDAGMNLFDVKKFIGWEGIDVFWKHYYSKKPNQIKVPKLINSKIKRINR